MGTMVLLWQALLPCIFRFIVSLRCDSVIDPISPVNLMNSENNPKPALSLGTLLLGVLGVIIVFAAVMSLARPKSNLSHIAIGKPAPALDLIPLIADPVISPGPNTDAESDSESESSIEDAVSLTGQPQFGKVTVLHFWGTWCPPCKAEYPHLIEAMKRRGMNPTLQFISVSCESDPSATFEGLQASTRKYYEKIAAGNLPTYADARGVTRHNVTKAFEEPSIVYPTTLIIDTNQRIAGVWQGYTESSLAEMETLIDNLLESAG